MREHHEILQLFRSMREHHKSPAVVQKHERAPWESCFCSEAWESTVTVLHLFRGTKILHHRSNFWRKHIAVCLHHELSCLCLVALGLLKPQDINNLIHGADRRRYVSFDGCRLNCIPLLHCRGCLRRILVTFTCLCKGSKLQACLINQWRGAILIRTVAAASLSGKRRVALQSGKRGLANAIWKTWSGKRDLANDVWYCNLANAI